MTLRIFTRGGALSWHDKVGLRVQRPPVVILSRAGALQPNDGVAQPRVAALDGIRGIAIIWVILHNSIDVSHASATGILWVLSILAHPGWIGVQLFFALSGFLITAGLLDTRGTPHFYRNFYVKRALRILPLYYSVLLLLLVIAPRVAAPHWPFDIGSQASLWLFTVNWTHTSPYGFAHFWSLAVEEQFYLVWPLLVFWLTPRRLLTACICLSVLALVLRSAMVAMGADGWTLYTLTPCRIDALALGAAGACAVRIPELKDWMRSNLRPILMSALILFLAGIPLTHLYDRYAWTGETYGYSLLAVSCGLFVTAIALAPKAEVRVAGFLAWAPLRSIGKYSYAMYVFHGLLIKMAGEPWMNSRFAGDPSAAAVIVYVFAIGAASYLLGYLSFHLLEKHFLKLKRFFAPRPQVEG
jgi:peptidoglycan/LPS O-acetylase OafA/YrhL